MIYLYRTVQTKSEKRNRWLQFFWGRLMIRFGWTEKPWWERRPYAR